MTGHVRKPHVDRMKFGTVHIVTTEQRYALSIEIAEGFRHYST